MGDQKREQTSVLPVGPSGQEAPVAQPAAVEIRAAAHQVTLPDVPSMRERRFLHVPLEVWALLLVLVVALVIRLDNLGSLPNTVLADEADNAQDAIRIMYGLGPSRGFFGLDWTGQPAFDAYALSLVFKLFGVSVFTMRLLAALFSTLALVPFYFLLRRHFAAIPSLAVTLLLSTVVWYLNFSRSGWNNVYIAFFLLSAMLAFVSALDGLRPGKQVERRSWVLFALAGVCSALALYGYPSGRTVILGLLAFFPLGLLFYQRTAKRVVAGYALLILAAGAVFAPQAANLVADWQHYMGRSDVVLITQSKEFQENPAGTLWLQVARNARGPWDGNVNNTPQYSPPGEPQLDTFSGWLVLVGMALSLFLPWLRRRADNWLCWVMLLVAWSSTQVLTAGTPNGARGAGWMPLYLYFAAVTLDAVWRIALYAIQRFHLAPAAVTAAQLVPAGLLLALAVWASVSNVLHYVAWQDNPRTRTARWIFLDVREFPDWSSVISAMAASKQGEINVGQWRHEHPEYTATNNP